MPVWVGCRRNTRRRDRKGDATLKRIYVIDDDDLFRESLEQNLRDTGYEVAGFGDGQTVLDRLAQGEPVDLLLLDWKMPGMTGIEVLRRMRARGDRTPVIFLTALSDQIYEEAALTSGAVDFLEKSRSFAILEKSIELIREGVRGREAAAPDAADDAAGTPSEAAGVRRLGRLELRHEIGRAFWDGNQVELTLTEYRMVEMLAERAGQDVRYRDLYDLVHGRGFVAGQGDDGFRGNVRTFIKRIRQKFKEIDAAFEEIENYPGFGYRWRER